MCHVDVIAGVDGHAATVSDTDVRPVVGRIGYYVGRDGSGWKKDCTGKFTRLNIHRRRDGCALISVTRGGKKIGSIYLARAVLMAFVGPPPSGHVARHWPDPDPLNNRVENLCWGLPGDQRFRVVAVEAEFESCIEEPPISPPPSRFIGPLARLLMDDWRRQRRLMRSRATVATYREAQAKAGHRFDVRSRLAPSSWDRSEGRG